MNAPHETSGPYGLALDRDDLAWLSRLARALLSTSSEVGGSADDLVQETVVVALTARGEVIEHKRPWLRSVAKRLLARRRRTELRRSDGESLVDVGSESGAASHAPAAVDLVAAAEAAERVAGAARGLPEPLRQVVLAHFLEGLEPREIAERSAQKVDTVRWRLRRGLELLRAELQEDPAEAARARDAGSPPTHWSNALVALAALSHQSGRGASALAPASAGASSALQWTLSFFTMKLFATVGLAVTLALLVWQGNRTLDPAAPASVEPAVQTAAVSEPPSSAESDEPVGLAPVASREPRTEGDGAIGEASDEALAGLYVTGRVVNAAGEPVDGAVVYVARSFEDEPWLSVDAPAELAGRAVSEPDGSFRLRAEREDRWLEDRRATAAVCAVAPGFLRATPLALPADASLADIELILASGVEIEGRVEDESGEPVAGLTLWAADPSQRASDVSMSRVWLSGARRLLAAPGQPERAQAVARTNGGGGITLRGLLPGPSRVRSLDPAWQIIEPTKVDGGTRGVVWVAAPRLGVRLRGRRRGALLAAESKDLSLAQVLVADPLVLRATFRVELRMQDGTTLDTGQWMGRGAGEVTFGFQPDMDPRVDLAKIDSAVFYGTATLEGEEVEWRAPELRRDALVRTGAIVAYAEFEGRASQTDMSGDEPAPSLSAAELVDVEFDVIYAGSGAPFDGPLYVDWVSEDADGRRLEGDGRARRLPSGRYGLRVPAERVRFFVQEAGASGSLAPWSGIHDCRRSGRNVVYVELNGGGGVLVGRPPGWTGEWWIRAYRRSSAEEEWRGAWTYSIDAAEHPLSALEPAEWRFELREDPDQGPPSEVFIVTVRAGETVRVP